MPRRSSVPPEDRFLRANLNDPDNQAALLRAYLDLKRQAEELAQELAQAKAQPKTQAAGPAPPGGQTDAGADRLAQWLRLIRWAAEKSAAGQTFVVGQRQDLGQLLALVTAGAEAGGTPHQERGTDTWTVSWSGGREETVVAVGGPRRPAMPRTARPARGRSPAAGPETVST